MSLRHVHFKHLLQVLSLFALFLSLCGRAPAQTEIDTVAITVHGDTARFWLQIPAAYDSAQPPAILIWWHQWGGSYLEMKNFTEFEIEANLRGWIAASHNGPNLTHWNAWSAQEHCQSMLYWIRERYPFHMDSIYMIGGSMGGAAGQVWHNNHCGEHDFFIAAAAGGSQILDCQLRQEQYLANGDTNQSMRTVFGGLPGERDSVAFEYHRASAIFLADTGQSMHFNSLHLPVWSIWGNTDGEREAYGNPALLWDSLRRASDADTTYLSESEAPCHGLQCMWPPGVCDWLSRFTADRYPDDLSINADENGKYYWTQVELARNDTVFGRYGLSKSPQDDELNVNLVKNIQLIRINAAVLDLQENDTLSGIWQNLDAGVSNVDIVLTPVPPFVFGTEPDGSSAQWSYDSLSQSATVLLTLNGFYQFGIGRPLLSPEPDERAIPRTHRLISAYPNPFNAQTTLTIESNGGKAELLIYNLLGRLVRIMPLALSTGETRVTLDAKSLGSGVFFIRLKESQQPPLKVILLR